MKIIDNVYLKKIFLPKFTIFTFVFIFLFIIFITIYWKISSENLIYTFWKINFYWINKETIQNDNKINNIDCNLFNKLFIYFIKRKTINWKLDNVKIDWKDFYNFLLKVRNWKVNFVWLQNLFKNEYNQKILNLFFDLNNKKEKINNIVKGINKNSYNNKKIYLIKVFKMNIRNYLLIFYVNLKNHLILFNTIKNKNSDIIYKNVNFRYIYKRNKYWKKHLELYLSNWNLSNFRKVDYNSLNQDYKQSLYYVFKFLKYINFNNKKLNYLKNYYLLIEKSNE